MGLLIMMESRASTCAPRPQACTAEPGLPWSPEFMEARGRALEGDWAVPELGEACNRAGTVNAAIVSYYQSSAFRYGLAKSSQQMRASDLGAFSGGPWRQASGGTAQGTSDHLEQENAGGGLELAQGASRFHRPLPVADMLAGNPLAGVKLVPIKSDGHHPWELEECGRFGELPCDRHTRTAGL